MGKAPLPQGLYIGGIDRRHHHYGCSGYVATQRYQKLIDEARERVVVLNLRAIHSAAIMNKAKTGWYMTQNLDDLSEINNYYSLNIESDYGQYWCEGDQNLYDIVFEGPNWQIHIDNVFDNGTPHCDNGVCPTCSYSANDPCPAFVGL